jgi:hypothetical protein
MSRFEKICDIRSSLQSVTLKSFLVQASGPKFTSIREINIFTNWNNKLGCYQYKEQAPGHVNIEHLNLTF